jgi:hypothetical protein
MKKTISEWDFQDAFSKMGRGEQFSHEGLKALYTYLEEMENQCDGMEIELDVIALCCEYTEYANIEEFQADHGEEYECQDDIEMRTTFIPVTSDSFIIQQF